MGAPESYKVGEAPWETGKGQIFKVGEAPWEKPAAEDPSMLGSAVRKFAQGASGGFSDEMAGAAEAAGRAVGLNGVGGPMKNIGINPDGPTLDSDKIKQAYQMGRDHERQALALDTKAHPAISAVADLGGAVMSPINKVAGPLGAFGGGAVIGGTQALGNSEATDLPGLAKDTAIGAGLGGVVGKVADIATPYIEAGVQKVGQKAKDAAEMMSARAQGAERGTIKKFGIDAVKSAGRQGLDNDVVTTFGNTTDKIAANEALKAKAMDARKAAYDTIDKAGASEFNPVDAATDATKKVLEGKNLAHKDTQDLISSLTPHLENILSRGDENISMDEAQKLVSSLGKAAKFDTSRSNEANDVAKQVYQSVRQSINEAADKGADKVGVQGLKDTIEQANKTYSTAKVSEALLKNKQAREGGNKLFSLTDTIAGTGAATYGLATGDWKGAGEAMLAKKAIDKAPQFLARGLDGIAAKLLQNPEVAALAQKSPAAFQSILSHFESPAASLPKAAEQTPPLKGESKWANDGAQKLIDHAPDDKATIEKAKGAMSDPKVKALLIQASDLKANTPAMTKVMTKLKSQLASGDDN